MQQSPRPPAPAGNDGSGELPITDIKRTKTHDKVGQVQRLWVIVKNSGRSTEEVKAWLAVAYGYGSSKEIKRKHYEEICAAIEAAGPLRLPAGAPANGREPGEDDQ